MSCVRTYTHVHASFVQIYVYTSAPVELSYMSICHVRPTRSKYMKRAVKECWLRLSQVREWLWRARNALGECASYVYIERQTHRHTDTWPRRRKQKERETERGRERETGENRRQNSKQCGAREMRYLCVSVHMYREGEKRRERETERTRESVHTRVRVSERERVRVCVRGKRKRI